VPLASVSYADGMSATDGDRVTVTRAGVETFVWRVSVGLILLSIVAVLFGLPGAPTVAPWLFVLGVVGVLFLVLDRVQAWVIARWFG
jgi:hypothetical protein